MITRDESRYIQPDNVVFFPPTQEKLPPQRSPIFLIHPATDNISHVAHRARTIVVEVNREQCNLVFLRISREMRGEMRDVSSLSFAIPGLPGRTGGTRARHVPLYLIILPFPFFCKILFALLNGFWLSTSLTNVTEKKTCFPRLFKNLWIQWMINSIESNYEIKRFGIVIKISFVKIKSGPIFVDYNAYHSLERSSRDWVVCLASDVASYSAAKIGG